MIRLWREYDLWVVFCNLGIWFFVVSVSDFYKYPTYPFTIQGKIIKFKTEEFFFI